VFTGRAVAADKTLTVTSWGGDYNKSVREVFADPSPRKPASPSPSSTMATWRR